MDLTGLLSGFGLSGAAGLNAYIPLLAVSVLGRFGIVKLSGPFELLTSGWAIGVIALLLLVELIVDKVPGADHVNDIVQSFVRPAAGAVLFASGSGVLGQTHPGVSLVCGLLLAFGVHATKAAARPVVNASTAGIGAPVVSLAEDVTSAVVSAVAIFIPILIALFVVAFVAVAIFVWRRYRALRHKTATAHSG
ncbi:MAG: DUF4126 domain-containing protein [Myxococcaceae bacterium]